jgi:hypothetical protein
VDSRRAGPRVRRQRARPASASAAAPAASAPGAGPPSAAGPRTTDPADLSTGTATFPYTDLEGSTRLLRAHPAAYQTPVRRHPDLLRGMGAGVPRPLLGLQEEGDA